MNNDLKTIVERVIPAIHFALVTPQDIAVLESADDLWAALVYRKSFECMIFASPDINLLCRLVGQKYVPFYYQNTFSEGAMARLGIPTNCSTYFALQDDYQVVDSVGNVMNFNRGIQPCITPTNSDTGCWAVSGLNGFCVARDVAEAISILIGNKVKVPMAIWCEDFSMGIIKARESYAKRFYQRYDFRYESIGWIPMDTNCYIDEAYDQREQRRQKDKAGLIEIYENGF